MVLSRSPAKLIYADDLPMEHNEPLNWCFFVIASRSNTNVSVNFGIENVVVGDLNAYAAIQDHCEGSYFLLGDLLRVSRVTKVLGSHPEGTSETG